jgi:predicted NAD/FAD-binding protein/DUF1365 family protein
MSTIDGPSSSGERRVAVVGSGVAGLVAAYVASRSAHVTLFEADDRLGGHADTHLVDDGVDGLAIDTGFIVHNERTYPVLLRLFAELAVETQESEMSMSISDAGTGLEWAGALGREGVLPTRGHLANPRYLRMLTEIPRFHRRAKALLARPGDDLTLRAFLEVGGFTPYFARHFMEPLVAAVWSCDPAIALEYPARYLFSFLQHHGMLSIKGSPTWRTVTGGSRAYVDRVAAALAAAGAEVRLGTKVTSVLETGDGVTVTDGNGAVTSYDAVVVATHPSQALAMLAEPTPRHTELLGAMPYSPNTALLHTDTSVLPALTNTWASWNFRRPAGESDGLVVTYDLTRLQRLPTDTHYLVTLGGDDLIDPALVIDRMEYEHPQYTPASVAAQARLPELDSDRVAFAGAYHGWGFHEDGARSGLAAAERLGFAWDADPTLVEVRRPPGPEPRDPVGRHPVSTTLASLLTGFRGSPASAASHLNQRAGGDGVLFDTTIRHTRRTPFKRTFTHRSHTWLVDLDELPDHGSRSWLLGSFEARDHLGAPDRTIRENVDAFVAAAGEQRPDRILMAAHPRTLGHSFNPISVFWCLDDRGAQVATVVEVHNTYGDRHAYLVHPDAQGRARTDKAMYVSPFHGTDGYYELAVPLPDERLRIAVTLHSDDGATFSAALEGNRSTASPWQAAGAALRGAALIRVHGIWLWLRRLPLRTRPHHHQEGVS